MRSFRLFYVSSTDLSSPNCPQRPATLPGGAEAAAAESQQEDQHLHRHLHALLRSIRHHAVSVGWDGGIHACTMQRMQPLMCLLTTPTSPLPTLHADLVISNMAPLPC